MKDLNAMTNAMTRFIRRVALVAAMGFAMAIGGTASAQFGEMAGISEATHPEYLSRDIVLFCESLKLDDAQRVIAEAMFNDYQAAFDQSMTAMKQKYEEMHDQLTTGDKDQERVLKLVFAPIRQQLVERKRLGEQFMQNLKVVLSEEQMAYWPAFERRLFREKNLNKGRLSGESVNLLDAIRDAQLDEKTAQNIAPLLEEYEIALDGALRAREASTVTPENKMMMAMEGSDINEQLAEQKRQMSLRLGVRNVNDNFIERIGAALPERFGAAFRQSALDRAYPRVYRETPVQRIMDAADALEGLEPDVKKQIGEMHASFLTDLANVNKELLDSLRAYEPEEVRYRAESFARKNQNQPTEPPNDVTRPKFQNRDEMSRQYVRRLKDLLTAEQFEQLPGATRWVETPAEEQPPAAHPNPSGAAAGGPSKPTAVRRGGDSRHAGNDGNN